MQTAYNFTTMKMCLLVCGWVPSLLREDMIKRLTCTGENARRAGSSNQKHISHKQTIEDMRIRNTAVNLMTTGLLGEPYAQEMWELRNSCHSELKSSTNTIMQWVHRWLAYFLQFCHICMIVFRVGSTIAECNIHYSSQVTSLPGPIASSIWSADSAKLGAGSEM